MLVIRILLGFLVLLVVALTILPKAPGEANAQRDIIIKFALTLGVALMGALILFALFSTKNMNTAKKMQVLRTRLMQERDTYNHLQNSQLTVSDYQLKDLAAQDLENFLKTNKVNKLFLRNLKPASIATLKSALNYELDELTIDSLSETSLTQLSKQINFTVRKLHLLNLKLAKLDLGELIQQVGLDNLHQLELNYIQSNNWAKMLTLSFPKLNSLIIKQSMLDAKVQQQLFMQLAQSNQLQELTLNSVGLEEGALKQLAIVLQANLKLQMLDLSYNKMFDLGLEYLKNPLKKLTNLTTINLIGNNINDQGVKILLEIAMANPAIASINISSKNISSELLNQLNLQLTKNRN